MLAFKEIQPVCFYRILAAADSSVSQRPSLEKAKPPQCHTTCPACTSSTLSSCHHLLMNLVTMRSSRVLVPAADREMRNIRRFNGCHVTRYAEIRRARVFTPLMESVIHRCCCYHIVLFIVLLRWFVYSWRSTAVIGYALRSELCQWTELNFMVTRAAIGSIAERIQQSKYRIIVTVTNHNVNQCQ